MILHRNVGAHGRPPDPWSTRIQHQRTGHGPFQHHTLPSNRFSVFNENELSSHDDNHTTRKISSIVQFVKFNQPHCPPIVDTEDITSKPKWKTVTHKKKPLRNLTNTEHHEKTYDRFTLTKLITTSKLRNTGKVNRFSISNSDSSVPSNNVNVLQDNNTTHRYQKMQNLPHKHSKKIIP